jgi:glutathione S-transferase
MRKLYHYPLCAFGRLIRVYLVEKKLDYESIIDFPWNRKNVFSDYHVFSDLPTLVDHDGSLLEGWYAIIEHMEQYYRSVPLLGVSPKEKSETRRMVVLFNEMFFSEVTKNIVFEKVMRKHIDRSSPDSTCIRRGNGEIKKYFDYISHIIDCKNWLAGNEFSMADIAAASQISCVDYVGSIEWNSYPGVKDWYVRVKSRPSFRDILLDRIPNITPPSYYQELDF